MSSSAANSSVPSTSARKLCGGNPLLERDEYKRWAKRTLRASQRRIGAKSLKSLNNSFRAQT